MNDSSLLMVQEKTLIFGHLQSVYFLSYHECIQRRVLIASQEVNVDLVPLERLSMKTLEFEGFP